MAKFGKKGVTLLETVIAMVLVSILTISVLSIAISSTSAEGRTKAKYLCVNEGQNIVTMFQNADKLSTDNATLISGFENNLNFCYGVDNWQVATLSTNKTYTIKFNSQIKPTTANEFEYFATIQINNYSTLKIEFKRNSNGTINSVYKATDYTLIR